ncbi:T9SS type A sorting domain-containing protein [Dyadobacter sp. CY326]|uniref:T9SS type A sorting domain-containing protein n=1 Tax=Dyadobacter sp. CY326 TaxID=2907300 RepID=UPI001F3B30AC|nr:T9SS type A sorting domain-containing protein [Dyadobacter sp. CY326]MCE7064325.1 T9SS type A sorting domain-containing protein [Dyadobacter sp. CY326]
MKNTLNLTILLAFLSFAALAQCTIGEVRLTSQADVDNFSVQYPSCTKLIGNLLISGPDITSLSGLLPITTITGDIQIYENPLLTSLAGLNSLTSVVNGKIQIASNPVLATLNGLNALTTITNNIPNLWAGEISISYNPGLVDLTGLTSLTTLSNTLGISNNAGLISLAGLDVLASVPFVNISDNAVLTSLFDHNLTSCSEIILYRNNALPALSGFGNLTQLKRAEIVLNPSLISLSGLSTITSFTDNLVIRSNNALINLNGLNNLKEISGLFRFSDGSTTPVGLDKLDIVRGQLLLQNNTFETMSGFTVLRTVLGRLTIEAHPNLKSLDGLESLEGISGDLIIRDNPLLESIAALKDMYIYTSPNLIIEGSPLLSDCANEGVCIYLEYRPNNAFISGNGEGCSSNNEVKYSPTCIAVLPVDLVYFKGTKSVEGNKLIWETASETNNKGFEVQRSLNGRNFETIAFVNGYVDSKRKMQYEYIDIDTQFKSYYRLKQVDLDGSSTLSRTIVMNADGQIATVYPNPAHGQLHIQSADKNQPYSIRNVQGFSVMESSVLPSKPLDTSSLQNGLYLITVGKEVFKVAVQN